MSNIKRTNRNDLIVKLLNRGLTMRQVCSIFKITVMRVYQIARIKNTAKRFKTDTHCVNCEMEAHGKIDNNKFFFKGTSVNLCMPCVKILREVKD